MSITELMKFKRGQRKMRRRGGGARGAGGAAPNAKDPNASEEEESYKPLEWPLVRKMLTWMAPYKGPYAIALLLNVLFTVLEMLGRCSSGN